jgi:hypothetical protein
MRGWVGGLQTSDAALDQARLNDVVLGQVVVFLKEYAVCYTLEKVLPEHGLRLRLLPHRLLEASRDRGTHF